MTETLKPVAAAAEASQPKPLSATKLNGILNELQNANAALTARSADLAGSLAECTEALQMAQAALQAEAKKTEARDALVATLRAQFESLKACVLADNPAFEFPDFPELPLEL